MPQGLQKRTEGAPPWLVTISRRSTVSLMHETISSPEPRRFVRTFGLDLQAVKHALEA